MRRLVSTEIGTVLAFAVGVLVSYVGLALSLSGRERIAGVLLLTLGLWAMVAAPITHDQLHRERGQPAHAVWGRGERRKPRWWPSR